MINILVREDGTSIIIRAEPSPDFETGFDLEMDVVYARGLLETLAKAIQKAETLQVFHSESDGNGKKN